MTKTLHTTKYSQNTKKTTHTILCTKVWQEKVSFIQKNIPMYGPQSYKALSTSKEDNKKWCNKQLAQSQKNQY
jgi:hypothetical protein